MKSVRNLAHIQGYAVLIFRSDQSKVVIKRDRGGIYLGRAAADQEPVQKCASRLMGCPFRAKGHLQNDGNWIPRTDVAEHNQPAFTDMGSHPTARRLLSERKILTHQMLIAGIAPRDIVTSLR